MMVER